MAKRIICVRTAYPVAHTRTIHAAEDTVISFDLDPSALLNRAKIPFVEALSPNVLAIRQSAAMPSMAQAWRRLRMNPERESAVLPQIEGRESRSTRSSLGTTGLAETARADGRQLRVALSYYPTLDTALADLEHGLKQGLTHYGRDESE